MSNGRENCQRASQRSCQAFNTCERLVVAAHVAKFLKKGTFGRAYTQHIHAGLGLDMEAYINNHG